MGTHVGHYLREWRQFRRMTVTYVAQVIGVSHSHISRIERGKLPYSQRILEALAEVYQTTPAALLSINPLATVP